MSSPLDSLFIEHAMGRLLGDYLGQRGLDHDADIFDAGNPQDLAKVVDNIAKAIRIRFELIPSPANESDKSKVKTRVDTDCSRLEKISGTMAKFTKDEPKDYHWRIIGSLVSVIDALLEHADA